MERWTPPVYRFCRRILNHEQDAHDAAQDTLVKVLKNLHRYDPRRRFSTWVFSVARNTCIDEHRKRKRRSYDEPNERDLVDTRPGPLQHVARAERSERLQEALTDLPELYREVLVLYHFEHKKYTEIADLLDIPMGTVMNRIFRARKKLRVLYEARGGERA